LGCAEAVSISNAIPDIVSHDAWLAIANAFPVLAYRLDADGSVVLLNDRWFEEVGLRDSHLDFGYRDAVHPSDRARVARRFRSSLASGDPYEDEFRMRVRNGRYRTFRSSARASRDASGAIVAWQGIAIDIEEIVAARRRQADADTHLRAFLQAVPQIVWTADATGWIDWYNDRWFEYTGQSAHHPDDFLRVMELWLRSIETGERFELEFRLRGRDGTYRWFLTRFEPLRNDTGEIVRWYGSNTDIDVQKRARERISNKAEMLQQAFLAEHPDGFILISCGDVAGQGVAASVSVGGLRRSILLSALELADPAAILERSDSIVRFEDTSAASSPDDVALLVLQSANPSTTAVTTYGMPPLVKRWLFHSSDARTARESRREVMTFLTALAARDAELFVAELILGEILANTVEHAPGLVEITIDWTGACPLLTVRDSGPGLPDAVHVRPQVPLDPLDENGRGLFLIATLACDVRVESPVDGGTCIVATLPLARRVATDASFDEVAQA
jgi:PAS domain S-box-containing protein